jgi:hypothetical protein
MLEMHRRIVVGVEIESYSISEPEHRIGRGASRPRRGLSEKGECFAHDTTIGSEYNSRPFATVREALFLLKTGLRKYLRRLYRRRREDAPVRVPFLVGGWTNRFAGAHLHISLAERDLTYREAKSLAFHVHGHLPFLIAAGVNSPVWNRRLTPHASVRYLRGAETYFAPQPRGQLAVDTTTQLCFVPPRGDKPPTLEIRVLDSNLPEYIVVCLCLAKAIALRWLRRRPSSNRLSQAELQRASVAAAQRGTRARLCWGGRWMSFARYQDRFIQVHREEFERLDIPDQLFRVMRLFKKGWDGARMIREAVHLAQKQHPPTWQRHFAKRYAQAIEQLLSGNSLDDFARSLRLNLPDTRRVWLGSKEDSIDE